VHGHDLPGTLLEHLRWLSEAGFAGVEVLWKNMNIAVVCGIRAASHTGSPRPAIARGGQSESH
jgi:hypothetical protein